MSCHRNAVTTRWRLRLLRCLLLLSAAVLLHDEQQGALELEGPFCFLAATRYGVSLLGASAAPRKGKDYYRILGVRKNASQRTIDKAYRKLAKQLHPDRAPGKEKEFMEVAKAHEVLSDSEQRKQYDLLGEEGLGGGTQGGPGAFPFDMFAHLFNGGKQSGGGGGGGGGGGIRFEFSDDIPEYMKGFGFGTRDPPADDYDADLYDDAPFVAELNPQNYREIVEERDDIMVVSIYNPHCEPCRVFKLDFAIAAENLAGIIPFGSVNCRKHKTLSLCKKGRRYPTVFIFPTDKNAEPIVYQGKSRKFEAILDFVAENIPKYYTELTMKNMEDWLTKSSKQRVIAFSKRQPPPPHWTVGAMRYKNTLEFGVVYSQQSDLLTSYFTRRTSLNGDRAIQNLRFPSLLHVLNIDTLQGDFKKFAAIDAKNILTTLGIIAAQSRASNSPKFHQLTARRMRAGECVPSDSQFCIILLLPSKEAAVGASKEICGTLKMLADKYKNDPVKIVWVDGATDVEFSRAFELDVKKNSELLVAYRPKRKRYDVLIPPLEKIDIERFIDRALSGSQLPKALKGSPTLEKAASQRQSSLKDEF